MQHQLIDLHTRPLGALVVIRSRDDLDPGASPLTAGIGRTVLTALPDHVGVCEVVSVGPLVKNTKPGDVCMLDFYETKQTYQLDGEDLFVVDSDALRARFDVATATVHPLPDYIMTKRVPKRFARAFFGRDDIEMPDNKVINGVASRMIYSQKLKREVPCFHVVYEEVVEVGANAVKYGAVPGDLAVVVTDFAMKIRQGSENYRIAIPEMGVCGIIDDTAQLAVSMARKPVLHLPDEPRLIVL